MDRQTQRHTPRLFWIIWGLTLSAALWGLLPWRTPAARPAAAQPAKGYVALTFDDGPKAETTPILLDGLRQRGVKATFFLIGQQAQACPDLVRRMADEGHQIGLHTWDHQDLSTMSRAELTAELERTRQTLTALIGPEAFMIRPPYGFVSQTLKESAGAPILCWSVDTLDWKHRDPARITDTVLREVRDGSIVLMHDIFPTSVQAALTCADRLLAEGYWLVTVEELFALRGISPAPGQVWHELPPQAVPSAGEPVPSISTHKRKGDLP